MDREVTLMEMLEAREVRAGRQRELLERYARPVVSFTLNIAGPVKNGPVIRRAFREGLLRLEDALAAGKRLCVPLCTGPGIMELRQITALSQLSPGAYGIPEPPADAPTISVDETDFAILPCLTCNHLGHRLGQGAGYYDRFLAHYRSGTVLLCREKLIREEIPLEPHDYPVPWVLTERGLYEDGIPARLE